MSRSYTLELVTKILFGKIVFADTIKLMVLKWERPGLSKCTLNPMASVPRRDRKWPKDEKVRWIQRQSLEFCSQGLEKLEEAGVILHLGLQKKVGPTITLILDLWPLVLSEIMIFLLF